MKIASFIHSAVKRILRKIMLEPDFQQPVVVVLGATGAGKSKLALEIASKYNGEIINADSMQIYQGLDIATNKVTPQELDCVPHHMLGFLNPLKTYTVVDFCNSTLPIISKLHQEKKLPVIVGGTHYYVESLLWNVLIQPSMVDPKIGDRSAISESDIESRISDMMKCIIKNTGSPKEKVNSVCNENLNKVQECLSFSANLECDKSGDISKLKMESDYRNSDSAIGDGNDKCVFTPMSDLSQIREKMDNLTNEELWKILKIIDPDIAAINHPNDRRKILRSLEVWAQTGVRHSEHLRRQREEVGVGDLGGRTRFQNVALLWVTCDQVTLDKRVDDRVDAMLSDGLLEELEDFHDSYNAPLLQSYQKQQNDQSSSSTNTSNSSDIDEHYKKGIFQCIGLKEFHHFLCLPKEEKESEKGKKLYAEAVDSMKLRTRQYSRRQIKWIRNRILLRDRKKIPVYAVDGSDPAQWSVTVSRVAEEVVSSVIAGRIPSTQPVSVEAKELRLGDKTRHTCEICDRVFIGEVQWKQHLNGARHRKVVQKSRRKEEALTNESSRKSQRAV